MNNARVKKALLVIAVAALVLASAIYLEASRLPSPTISKEIVGTPAATSSTASTAISWSVPSSVVTLSPSSTVARTFTFTSSGDLTDVVLEPVPAIAPFVTIQPNHLAAVSASNPVPVTIVFSIPASTVLGTYEGTIHAKAGRKTYPQTIKIIVNAWNSLIDPLSGFSTMYPPSLYDLSNATISSGVFSLESSPQGVAIGGNAPEDGSDATTTGFAVIIQPKPYSGTFDINAWIAAADSELDTLTTTTIGGSPGYEITFKNQVGAGRPTALVYRDGYLYQISYASTFAPGSVADQNGLDAFNSVLQNFTFSH